VSKFKVVILSLSVSVVAGFFARLINLPLPWMLGPLIVTMVISLWGVKLIIPTSLRKSSRLMIGVILGATVTMETLHRILDWPISLSMLLAGVLIITLVCSLYLYRVAGYDRITSLSASLPGAISTIPMIAIELGADPRRVILPHLLRVTLIVMFVPFVFSWWQGISLVSLGGEEVAFDWWGENLWVLLVALPVWWAASKFRLPIPELTGPMLAAVLCSLLGYRLLLPDWLFAATFLVLGAGIGIRFFGMTLSHLANNSRHAFVCTLITLAITLLIAWAICHLTSFEFHVILLAIMPGGIAEMTMLATVLGVDPVFVAFHQIFRSMLLNLMSPYVISRFGSKDK